MGSNHAWPKRDFFLNFKIDARKYSRKQKCFKSVMLMLRKQQQRARQWEAWGSTEDRGI